MKKYAIIIVLIFNACSFESSNGTEDTIAPEPFFSFGAQNSWTYDVNVKSFIPANRNTERRVIRVQSKSSDSISLERIRSLISKTTNDSFADTTDFRINYSDGLIRSNNKIVAAEKDTSYSVCLFADYFSNLIQTNSCDSQVVVMHKGDSVLIHAETKFWYKTEINYNYSAIYIKGIGLTKVELITEHIGCFMTCGPAGAGPNYDTTLFVLKSIVDKNGIEQVF